MVNETLTERDKTTLFLRDERFRKTKLKSAAQFAYKILTSHGTSKERSHLSERIIKDIQGRELPLTVLGAGYVGLPTAAILADAGFHVIALESRSDIVKTVNNGATTVNEPGLKDLISRNVQASRLRATSDVTDALDQAGAIVIAVQTPIDKNKKPDLSFLTKALDEIKKTMRKGMLIVVTSTVPPGTMFGMVKPKLESSGGLKADIDFYLAYVPERIAPGKAIKEFAESPRLVGGIGSSSTEVASELFRTVCKNVMETDALTAEVAKLAENTFRDVNVGYANQLALICEELGVDVMEVIKLANTHPRVNIHLPGPGVGGPCLPKDPYLLLSSSRLTDRNLISAARQINDYMPRHTVDLIVRALKDSRKEIKNSKVAVLGTAYKGDVDDSRLSPSGPLIHELMRLGCKVTAYDPYCSESFGAERTNSSYEATKSADCVVIATDHTEFKGLDLNKVRKLMNSDPIMIDAKRMISLREAEKLGFICYGIGFGKSKE
jgi:UDP-N-acetyl-D-mannosaminuronic acid dehydrogenase